MTDVAEEDSSGGDADGADASAAESAAEDADGPDGEDVAIDDLVARVAAVDEAAAAEVDALRARVDELEAEIDEREAALAEAEGSVDELESKLKRARADFQNYKKRAKRREEELRERATEDLVERLLDVRDNLVRALSQGDDVDVRDGVEATLATFDRVLEGENVSAIEPEVGGDVDPARHEVVHRIESDVPEGTIAEMYRPGYEMAGTVLRPAQVTVSEGAADDMDAGAGDDEGAGAADGDGSDEA